MNPDPRKNAPPRICDLPREDMQKVLFARHEARRIAYMRQCERHAARAAQLPRPSLFARLWAASAKARKVVG